MSTLKERDLVAIRRLLSQPTEKAVRMRPQRGLPASRVESYVIRLKTGSEIQFPTTDYRLYQTDMAIVVFGPNIAASIIWNLDINRTRRKDAVNNLRRVLQETPFQTDV